VPSPSVRRRRRRTGHHDLFVESSFADPFEIAFARGTVKQSSARDIELIHRTTRLISPRFRPCERQSRHPSSHLERSVSFVRIDRDATMVSCRRDRLSTGVKTSLFGGDREIGVATNCNRPCQGVNRPRRVGNRLDRSASIVVHIRRVTHGLKS